MDRFDDIWKNRFNEEPAPIDDWNTPDDLVWDAISVEVPGKKKRRRWWLLWLSLGLMFSVGLAVWIYNDITGGAAQKEEVVFEKLGTFISENQGKEIPVNIKKKEITTITGSAATLKKTITQKIDKVKEEKKTQRLLPTTPEIASFKSPEKPNEKQMAPGIPKLEVPQGGIYFDQQTTEASGLSPMIATKGEEATIARAILSKTEAITSLELLDAIPPGALQEYSKVDLQLLNPVPEEAKQSFKKNLAVALSSGALFWQHRISEKYTDDLSAFDFNYSNEFGWQSKVEFHYLLNRRISIISGLQYENVKSISGHNSALPYDPQAEQAGANNDYSLDLATPYGLAGADFRLNRTEDIGDEAVDLLVDFTSAHRIQNWSLPLLFQISPLRMSTKFNPLLTLGGGVNYLSGIQNNIQAINTNHDAIQFDREALNTSFAAPSIKKWFFDFRIGAGFQYQLNPSLQVQMNYQWARGINPIFEEQDYKTTIDRHQLSLGLVKRFD